jgi:hypothetical protein
VNTAGGVDVWEGVEVPDYGEKVQEGKRIDLECKNLNGTAY